MATSSLRILIVDPYPDTAESLALLTRAWGHSANTAGDAPSALDQFHRFRPDVTFIELQLPGDGISVVRQMRAEKASRELMIVAITGYVMPTSYKEAFQAGVDQLLVKPADPGEIQDILVRRCALALEGATADSSPMSHFASGGSLSATAAYSRRCLDFRPTLRDGAVSATTLNYLRTDEPDNWPRSDTRATTAGRIPIPS